MVGIPRNVFRHGQRQRRREFRQLGNFFFFISPHCSLIRFRFSLSRYYDFQRRDRNAVREGERGKEEEHWQQRQRSTSGFGFRTNGFQVPPQLENVNQPMRNRKRPQRISWRNREHQTKRIKQKNSEMLQMPISFFGRRENGGQTFDAKCDPLKMASSITCKNVPVWIKKWINCSLVYLSWPGSLVVRKSTKAGGWV